MERRISPQVPATAKMTRIDRISIGDASHSVRFLNERRAEAYWTGRRGLFRPHRDSWPNDQCAVASARMQRRGRGRRW